MPGLPLQIARVTPISLYSEPCVSAANPSGFTVEFPLVAFISEMREKSEKKKEKEREREREERERKIK